jgi:hypothetical protein
MTGDIFRRYRPLFYFHPGVKEMKFACIRGKGDIADLQKNCAHLETQGPLQQFLTPDGEMLEARSRKLPRPRYNRNFVIEKESRARRFGVTLVTLPIFPFPPSDISVRRPPRDSTSHPLVSFFTWPPIQFTTRGPFVNLWSLAPLRCGCYID